MYHLPLQDPPKFAQIAIFGLKICHLATLALTTCRAVIVSDSFFKNAKNKKTFSVWVKALTDVR
jgi:hypothetical protein